MKALGKILCFLGIHKWGEWERIHEPHYLLFKRKCQRCEMLNIRALSGEE